MQAAAEQLTVDCIRVKAGLFPTFLHVSGEALIEDGHDNASRSKAKSLLGPSCSLAMWERVLAAAGAAGWELTVDMFAASANAKLRRFMSWTDEPGSEQVDCSHPALGGLRHVQPVVRDISIRDGISRPGA